MAYLYSHIVRAMWNDDTIKMRSPEGNRIKFKALNLNSKKRTQHAHSSCSSYCCRRCSRHSYWHPTHKTQAGNLYIPLMPNSIAHLLYYPILSHLDFQEFYLPHHAPNHYAIIALIPLLLADTNLYPYFDTILTILPCLPPPHTSNTTPSFIPS